MDSQHLPLAESPHGQSLLASLQSTCSLLDGDSFIGLQPELGGKVCLELKGFECYSSDVIAGKFMLCALLGRCWFLLAVNNGMVWIQYLSGRDAYSDDALKVLDSFAVANECYCIGMIPASESIHRLALRNKFHDSMLDGKMVMLRYTNG